jgi:hypothetical protein
MAELLLEILIPNDPLVLILVYGLGAFLFFSFVDVSIKASPRVSDWYYQARQLDDCSYVCGVIASAEELLAISAIFAAVAASPMLPSTKASVSDGAFFGRRRRYRFSSANSADRACWAK